jgi:Leucine-rich repeat (LRR) protein
MRMGRISWLIGSCALAVPVLGLWLVAWARFQPETAEGRAEKAVKRFGKLYRDARVAGNPIVEVRFHETVNDAVLAKLVEDLKEFKSLHTMDFNYKDEKDPKLKHYSKGVTDAGLKHLKEFTSLTRLTLAYSAVTDAGVKDLKQLKGLISLNLSGTRVTDLGLKGLKDLNNLQVLYLSETRITDAGVKELKGLQQLQTLWLTYTKVSPVGLADLKEVPKLNELVLDDSQITDAALQSLRKIGKLHTYFRAWAAEGMRPSGSDDVHRVYLAHTRVTDTGLKELKDLKALKDLDVSATVLTDVGLKELKGLKNLEDLSLYGTRVTDAGVKDLKDFKALKNLNLTLTQITDAGGKELQAALPQCRIRR